MTAGRCASKRSLASCSLFKYASARRWSIAISEGHRLLPLSKIIQRVIPPGNRGGNDDGIEAIPPGNRGGNDDGIEIFHWF